VGTILVREVGHIVDFAKKWEPSVKKFGDNWILVVRYCRRPERKLCKPNLVCLTRTVDVKLGSVDDIQRMVSSRKEATDYLVRFRKHESIINNKI